MTLELWKLILFCGLFVQCHLFVKSQFAFKFGKFISAINFKLLLIFTSSFSVNLQGQTVFFD